MSGKKILLDLRFFHPGASGGIENYVYFILDSVKNLPVDIFIEIPFENYEFYKNRFPFIKNDRILIDPIQKFVSKFISIITLGRKRGILVRRRRKYSIVFDFVFYSFHMLKILHKNMNIISTIHAFLQYNEKEFNYVKKLVNNSTALITCWNYPYLEFLKYFPEKKDDWFLIHFIPLQNLTGQVEQIDELKNKKFFFYVSFFSERKNHARLLEAYNLAIKIKDDLPLLVLVGGGCKKIKINLRKRIKELNLNERIFLYDFLPPSKINYLYKNCYGVIAPTLWEAASGAVVEGVYAGKPVLCSNIAPLRDFAKYFKLQMLFFDPLDTKDIAKKIIEFCENYDSYNSCCESNSERLRHINHSYFAKRFYEVVRKYSQ